jgi:hypothetical protein
VHKVNALCPVLNAYEKVRVDRNRKLQQKSSGKQSSRNYNAELFSKGFHSVRVEWKTPINANDNFEEYVILL